jgi:hypothetical protein
MAIFIVPSELRKNSNLRKHIDDKHIHGMFYEVLPNLEALTGADVMISPDGLPFPRNDEMILLHIRAGAKLIQVKFGHDLPGSIIDSRLNEALARMQDCGAHPWQCLLLFVGTIGCDYTSAKVTINGQLTYGKKQMTWYQVDCAIDRWIDRGGSFNPLADGRLIPVRFIGIQNRVNEYQQKQTKTIMVKPAKFEEVIDPVNSHLKRWGIAQKIVVINDFRQTICAIPGVRIGQEKANAIYDYMESNNVHMSFSGFLSIVDDGSIVNVPGIGEGLLNAIKNGLYNVKEENDYKKKRNKKT